MLILLITACKKNNTTTPTPLPQPTTCDTCLPPITTNGAGTFGCRVNGKVWLPVGGGFNPGQWVEYNNQHLIVHGYNYTREQYVDIDYAPILDTGNYVSYNPNYKTQWARYVTTSPTVYFNADTIFHGYLHVLRFDPVKGFMAGTFSFDAYNNKGDTVHITDGRFDLHL